jgi:acetoacetyl-CoA synthetase
VEAAPMMQFARHVSARHGIALGSFADLHAWSIAERAAFWSEVWDWCGVVGEKGGVALGTDVMPGAAFFPQARLSYAENLLKRSDDGPALIFLGEDKASQVLSFAELHALVSRLQQALAAAGIGKGDRIAAMMPNLPQTIAIFLAANSLGAIFSSCSPDFGVRGVVDRFGQIEPKLLFACDGYWYAGKRLPILDKLGGIAAGLPDTTGIVVVDYLGEAAATVSQLPRATTFADFLAPHAPAPVRFERLAFNHPLYILYSSGTTGVPKCIVHGAGGALLKHLSEQRLHCGLSAGERFFYFTTCGWMMWNWLVTGLASGATLLLFDGSPFHPRPEVLFDFAAEHRAAIFGTSAKYIDACKKAGLAPGKTHDFSALRLLTSTGSPLAPESFRYIYEAIKGDMHLASISGGTDIVGCFVGGNPGSAVRIGEIQGPMLGMAVDVWDESGTPVRGAKGELVCTKAFPSMPVQFWNDPEGAKYRAAYFERFPGIWHHGDFAEWTANGGIVIYGRSDATLNPGGVRIGTAEIYAQVEQIPEVLEAIAIGQDWDGDVRVVLFVRLAAGAVLDAALRDHIRARIRAGASPRHVPARIIAVADIPRTKSGKITELAVRDVVHGREVKNKEALANPEALALYLDLPELRS